MSDSNTIIELKPTKSYLLVFQGAALSSEEVQTLQSHLHGEHAAVIVLAAGQTINLYEAPTEETEQEENK